MSLDRLKFRAWIKIPITQENGDKLDFSLCLHDVDVISGGSFAGFNEWVFADTLTRTGLTNRQKQEVWQFCDDSNISSSEMYYSIPVDMIEQCTGIRDKHGRLVYEGDILGGAYENLYIHYCDDCKQFQLRAKDYGSCMACEGDIHWYELVESENKNEIEVIGNIHENVNLLEDNAYGKPCGDNDKE